MLECVYAHALVSDREEYLFRVPYQHLAWEEGALICDVLFFLNAGLNKAAAMEAIALARKGTLAVLVGAMCVLVSDTQTFAQQCKNSVCRHACG